MILLEICVQDFENVLYSFLNLLIILYFDFFYPLNIQHFLHFFQISRISEI